MHKSLFYSLCLSLFAMLSITACNKDKVDNPQPVEQELITTLRLNVTDSTGFNQSFSYKVENGFEDGTGTITVDTLRLAPQKSYNVTITVLNEKKTPAEDVTAEIIQERNKHLFFFSSNPASGNGSIQFSNGNKDDNNAPFNQTLRFSTGLTGTGALTVTLKHEPTNKNATTATAAGGETDAEAVFPVILQ